MRLFLWFACHEAESECTGVSYDDWTEGFFLGKCLPCHSEDMRETFGAPAIDMHSYDTILENMSVIHTSIFESERMPPGGGLSEEERVLLEQWFACPH